MREPGGSVNTLRAPVELSTPMKVVLATLFVGAGAIHLAMAPIHAGGSTTEAVGFAIAGWLQVAVAIAIIVRPSWLVLGFGVVIEVAFVGAWFVSRMSGLPLGAHPGVAEPVGTVDLTCVVLEWAAVLLILTIALVPTWRSRSNSVFVGAAAIVSLGVLVFTSVLLSLPSTANHAHSDAASASGEAADGHVHGVSASTPVTTLVVLPDPPNAPLLARQLAKARDVALQYPTVADATRAGMYRITPFIPGVGAQYVAGFNVGFAHVSDELDLDHPLVYLYSGTGDTATVMGLVYYVFGPQPLPGFAGLDDRWLRRDGLCSEHVGDSKRLVAIDRDITQQDCADRGGTFASSVQWTLRVWAAPDWSNPAGPFLETNARVVCADVPPPYSVDVMTFGCTGSA
jgi:hypothetical protein